ncbi:hypothetical protein CPB84DRAFT_1813755 [Gymnopilus junonius]|uniref:RMT2 domain-containing protein n=1 Tax=Gymnopilus junonius TaxID=109634 RepID=A0A9P5NWQ9_GYMJU|nr:hypothetical protein CPB84DRAFT_1813755 [Gymnopilus junonius]
MDQDIDQIANEISACLQSGAPIWYQNLAEGLSPLHAAAFIQNEALVKLLLDKGALWNAVDYLKNTAGDVALSFNNGAIYRVIRDAGIRSGASRISLSSNFHIANSEISVDKHGQNICLVEVEGEDVGVMMGWEEGIMLKTVRKLCERHPKSSRLKVLNVGFGLGIIDNFFQGLDEPPIEHVIIEAHPNVLEFMKKTGWYEKPRVKILQGRWQEFIRNPNDLSIHGFDIVFTDTFSERYTDLRQFFECIPNLLADEDSRFSFFNGLGATDSLFYDVYTQISELHLSSLGLYVEWSDVDVSFDEEGGRWGRSREYFSLPIYRLPIARMKRSTLEC